MGTGPGNRGSGGSGQAHPYHHGDLRNALVGAAEAELAEHGIEGFTLRGCAKRAGVSHAAPAHHFGDAAGLLTAVAAAGFERFLTFQRQRQDGAPPDPSSQLVAAGLGYIDFATANPELFKLMFASSRADFSDPALRTSSAAAFEHLVHGVGAVRGNDPRANPAAMTDVLACWSAVHGLANLLMSHRSDTLAAMKAEERDRTMEEIIRRAVP